MHRWIFYLAFRYLFPRGRFGTFFTAMSILGITAGVTLLLVVLSIMNGFDDHIAQKLIQIHGSVKILATRPMDFSEKEVAEWKKVSGVQAITPFVNGIAMIQHKNRVALPKCLGLDPKTALSVLPIDRFMVQGTASDWENGVLMSQSLANECGLRVGDTFDLYSPLALEAIKQEEMVLPREVTVQGIFQTGWAEIDRSTILFPVSILQDLYGLGQQVHGWSVKADEKQLGKTCQALNALLPPYATAYAWNALNADFLYILKLEKAMCFFVLLFVVAVAAFSMSSGLMSSVVRKQRELALLRTWGASGWETAMLFGVQGLVLGICGIVSGFVCAGIVLYYRNAVVQGLTGWLLPKDALWNFYDVETLPAVFCGIDACWVTFFTLLITGMASLLPMWRLQRIPLVKRLRNGG